MDEISEKVRAGGFEVSFENVGRHKEGWSATLPDLEYDSLVASVRLHGRLMSRCIEFMVDDESKTGVIFAGMRSVGAFSWV